MRVPLIGTIFLLLLTAETVCGQKYPVHLSTPDHVGKKSRVLVIGSFNQDSASTLNGEVLKEVATNRLVIFEGREEVLAVDTQGMAVRESFTVEKFTSLENGVSSILLNPGSVILTDGGQDKANQIVLKNGVMDEAARVAFSLINPPHRPNSASDDDIYGTKEPKAVGDRWTINKAAAVADLKDTMNIPIERMTGVSSIVSKGTFGGEDCLNLLTEMSADGVMPPIGPEGFVPERGSLDMTIHTCVPLNPAVISRKEGIVGSAQFRFHGVPGTPFESVIVETTYTHRVEMTVLPDKP